MRFKNFKKKYSSSKGLTKKQTKAVKKIVKKEELKTVEAKLAISNIIGVVIDSSNPVNYHISAITQGLTDRNRIGDKIKIRAIHLRLGVNSFATNTVNDNMINTFTRVLVVQDRSYNTTTTGPSGGAQVNLLQLFYPDPESGLGGVYSTRNLDHLNTLIVLHDSLHVTNRNSNSKFFLDTQVPLKYCKREVAWANAGDVTNVTNGIFLIVVNDCPGAQMSKPIIYSQSRVLFGDA